MRWLMRLTSRCSLLQMPGDTVLLGNESAVSTSMKRLKLFIHCPHTTNQVSPSIKSSPALDACMRRGRESACHQCKHFVLASYCFLLCRFCVKRNVKASTYKLYLVPGLALCRWVWRRRQVFLRLLLNRQKMNVNTTTRLSVLALARKSVFSHASLHVSSRPCLK